MNDPDERGGSWTLLTGHGRVLVEIGRDPGARIRDISAVVGLTERTVQVIVADLEAAGYLTRTRTGRRTRYTVNQDSLFRHPAQEGQRVGPFLSLFAAADENARTTPGPDDSEIRRQQTLCVWKEFVGAWAIPALAAQRGAERRGARPGSLPPGEPSGGRRRRGPRRRSRSWTPPA
jgi:DNA-binding MarR family transcriptional regulator